MKRLIRIENGGRAFGCAGCKWTYPVEEFSAESSDFHLRQGFIGHDCDDPRFRVGANANSADHELAVTWEITTQLLADLCGVRGAAAASIQALSGATVAQQGTDDYSGRK